MPSLMWTDLAEVHGCEGGELEAHVGCQRVALRPVLAGRRAQHRADLVDLVYLGRAGEQRPPRVQLLDIFGGLTNIFVSCRKYFHWCFITAMMQPTAHTSMGLE